MTPHSHWEERLKDNRRVHNEVVQALAFGVSLDMCKAVARTEHAVRLGGVYLGSMYMNTVCIHVY